MSRKGGESAVANAEAQIRVAAFGDSLTFNNGRLKWKHWTEILMERFNLEIINAGVGGDTTAKGLKRIQSDVLEHNPDIVLINFGMNDHVKAGKYVEIVSLADYERNLRKMIELVRTAGSVPVLVTVSYIYEGDAANTDENYYYNRHDPAYYAADGGALARLDKYIGAMRKVARELDVPLADVRAACDQYDPREFTRDGVHLSALGNQVWAQVIGDCLADYVLPGLSQN
jgi:lysophospholipase L1-like esterase